MSTTLQNVVTAILFIGIAAALVVWFRSRLRRESQSRMYRMMARLGVYPGKYMDPESTPGLDMNAVRVRCRRCPSEDVCERWLAGEIEGDNGFCPNAKVFDGVVRAG